MRRYNTILAVLLGSLLNGLHESQATECKAENAYPALVFAAASELSYHADIAQDPQCPRSADKPSQQPQPVDHCPSICNIKDATKPYAQHVIKEEGLKVVPFNYLNIDLCDFPALKDRSPLLFADSPHQRNFILSFRGTKGVRDIGHDLLGGIGVIPQLYLDAEHLTAAVIDKLLDKNTYPQFATLTATGHSLGGGLAEYAAGKNGIHAVTFNSSHLSDPYIAEINASVDSYYDTEDKIGLLRIGGTYNFTKSIPIGDKSKNLFEAHKMGTMLQYLCEHQGKVKQPRAAHKPKCTESLEFKQNDLEALLESSPNLEDGIPSILHNGMRVAAIRNQHKGPHCKSDPEISSPIIVATPIIVDTAFRLGAIYDSYPAGGINIDSLRIFDLSQTKQAKAKSDIARDWRAAASVSFSIKNSNLSIVSTIDYQELDYHVEDEFDFDVLDVNLGAVWHKTNGDTSNRKGITNSVTSMSLVMQRFRNKDDVVGLLLGLDAAAGLTYADNQLFWVHGTGGKVVNSDAAGGDGYAVLGDAGVRHMLKAPIISKKNSIQLRVFGGRREAHNNEFSNTQWGAGVGLYSGWGEKGRLTTFIEPVVRWSHHHLNKPENNRYADREYSIRAEASYPMDLPLFGLGALRGWYISIGYTYSHSDAAVKLQNYDRNQALLQFDKQF